MRITLHCFLFAQWDLGYEKMETWSTWRNLKMKNKLQTQAKRCHERHRELQNYWHPSKPWCHNDEYCIFMVAGCKIIVWNITSIKNGDFVLTAGNSGKGESDPLTNKCAEDLAHSFMQSIVFMVPLVCTCAFSLTWIQTMYNILISRDKF